jgi:hypothetical protein
VWNLSYSVPQFCGAIGCGHNSLRDTGIAPPPPQFKMEKTGETNIINFLKEMYYCLDIVYRCSYVDICIHLKV